jgi:hypothetical protein
MDLIRAYIQRNEDGLCAMDILQEDIPQILPEIPIPTAAQMMLDNNIRTYFSMHHSGGILYPVDVFPIKPY